MSARREKRWLTVLSLFIFLMCMTLCTHAAIRMPDVSEPSSGNEFINVDGSFSSESVDTILDRINEIRKEAYDKGFVDSYVELTWSNGLEQIAQLRAVEANLLQAHNRPSGKSYSTILYGGKKSYGENLAWNNSTGMMGGIEQWYAEIKDYIKMKNGEAHGVTGHYENMINPSFKSMGLGCFKDINGMYCIAQEFDYDRDTNTTKSDLSGEYTQLVEVQESYLSAPTIKGANSVEQNSTEQYSFEVTGSFYSSSTKKTITGKYPITHGVQWESSDTTTATVSNEGLLTAVGTGETTVTAECGTISASKEIGVGVKKLKYAEVVPEQSSYEYRAAEIKPDVTVTLLGQTLQKDIDYTVSYRNNLNAGDAAIVIQGCGDFQGQTLEQSFVISKCVPGSLQVISSGLKYTGSPVHPKVRIRGKQGYFVVPESDYTAEYSTDCVDAGSVTMTLTTKTDNFTGNYIYSGIKFTIQKASIYSDAEVAAIEDQLYSGKALEPALTITYNGQTLTAGKDYTATYDKNTNVGTATVTITGSGNYTGSKTVSFTINPAPISDCNISIPEQTYTSQQLSPVVTVSKGDTELTAGQDFTYIPDHATAAGDTTITVTGQGNYTGTTTGTFTIKPASLDDTQIAFKNPDAVYTYSGEEIKPEVVVKLGGESGPELPVADYKVEYASNTNAGEATVTVLPSNNGNLTGSAEPLTFKIDPAVLSSDVNITLEASELVFNGTAQMPAVTKVEIGEKTLDAKADYSVSWPGAATGSGTDGQSVSDTDLYVIPGKYLVRVSGTGNYTGYQDATITISQASLKSDQVTIQLSKDTYIYSGSANTPEVDVKIGDYVVPNKEGVNFDVAYDKNINAGTGVVTVTAKADGVLKDAGEATFTIEPLSISDAAVQLADSEVFYDGTQHQPKIAEVSVKPGSGDSVLTLKDTEYTVSYGENVNAGDTAGSVTITAADNGNYKDAVTKTFAISPTSLKAGNVSIKVSDVTYTGEVVLPRVSIMINGNVISADNYAVSVNGNVNVGDATATITAAGSNLTDSVKEGYEILPASMEGAVVTLQADSFIYTGEAIEPDVVSVETTDHLQPTVADYTLVYEKNVNVGTAKMVLTGKGNYTGTAEKVFSINPAPISDCVISIPEQTYTSQPLSPVVTVSKGDKKLIAGQDYTYTPDKATAAGNTTITVTGRGNYTGTTTGTFTIKSASLKNALVAFKEPDAVYTYSGEEIKPEVVVKLSGEGEAVLPVDDYKVEYASNLNAGEATVTVLPSNNGNVTDSAEPLTFTIHHVDLSSAEDVNIALQASELVFNGSVQRPAVTKVEIGEKTLVVGEDYSVFWPGAATGTGTDGQSVSDTDLYVIPGKYLVRVTGTGNYTGNRDETVTILPASMTGAEVTLQENSFIYSGEAFEPVVMSVETTDHLQPTAADYTLAYENNVNAGTAKAVLTGTGNYTGSAEKEFLISPAPLTDAEVTVSDAVYTGAPVTTTVSVKKNGSRLENAKDYSVSYDAGQDYTNAGQASVKVVGCGNYTGEKEATFTISAADISHVTVSAPDQTWTGSELKPAVTAKLNGRVLPGTDYTVEYSGNIAVGNATIKITPSGNGNLAGTYAAGTFVIKEKPADPKPDQKEETPKPDQNKEDSKSDQKEENSKPDQKEDSASGQTQPKPRTNPNQVPAPDPVLGTQKTLEAKAKSVSENGDPKGSTFSLLQVAVKKTTKKSIRIGWKAVPKAAGYAVYGAPCGTKYRKLKDVKGTSFTQNKLKKGKYYKYFVAAYDKNGNILAASKTIHVATSGGKKGNPKSVKLNKKKVTLKKGKTFKLKAKQKRGKLKVAKHRKVAFETDNKKVATVSGSGKIKAVGPGTCYIYAYAQNGKFAKCKVTVKK